jgi:hypothetical protein
MVVGVLMSGVFAGSRPASAQTTPTLIAVPFEGHAGDIVYLSGAGFDPSQKLFITLACPDWYHSFQGNVEVLYGLRTDRHGRFLGYRALRAMTLTGTASSACQIYASNGGSPFAASAAYTIKSHDDALDECAIKMCMTATPQMIRSHLRLSIRGWPGAKANVTITYPDGRVQHAKTSLDWMGTQLLNLPLMERVPRRAQPRFSVTAVMDRVRGTVQGKFPSASP